MPKTPPAPTPTAAEPASLQARPYRERLLRVDDVCFITGLGRSTVHAKVKARRLPRPGATARRLRCLARGRSRCVDRGSPSGADAPRRPRCSLRWSRCMKATSMFYRCLHCRAGSTIRHSSQASPILREMIYQCTDAECGHSFVVHAAAVRTLSPSAKPDPLVYLPISEQTRRAVTEQTAITQPECSLVFPLHIGRGIFTRPPSRQS